MSEAFQKALEERQMRLKQQAATQRWLILAGVVLLLVVLVILFLRGREYPVNPNKASREVLMSLPEVGPEIAERILKLRPFKDAVDFEKRVPGIGPKTLEKMRSRLDFDGDGKADNGGAP